MTNADLSFHHYSVQEARLLSGLQLAYIGDAVHTLLVRRSLFKTAGRVHDMHKLCTNKVNAVAQAAALESILPILTQEELLIVKRGRNAHIHHTLPKSASAGDYSAATGFEALIGYLYLTGQQDRMECLYQMTQESL